MPTLLILAGGMGNRYGGDKQISAVGPNGEFLMEYAIYDAIKNDFKSIVILSSNEFISFFKHKLYYLSKHISINFVDQYEHDLNYPNYRKKPWGTAHAVWACRKEIKGQFLVLNADDFYGDETFKIANKIFKESKTPKLGLITFSLRNTLSNNGGVSRGLCVVNKTRLKSVSEHTNIVKNKMDITSNECTGKLSGDTEVSMNCWILHSSIFNTLGDYYKQFYMKHQDDVKAECGLPSFVQFRIENGENYRIYRSKSKWFGLTYPSDLEWCRHEIKYRVEKGRYPKTLSSIHE